MEWRMFLIWVIISLVAILIDIFTSSILFVWFAIGGIVSLVGLSLGASNSIQIIVFILVSAIGLIIGYPAAKKITRKSINALKTTEETYIGKELIAKDKIKNKANIKIDGIYWTIINKGGNIEEGEKFKIIGIEGNKFLIKKI